MKIKNNKTFNNIEVLLQMSGIVWQSKAARHQSYDHGTG